jgi:hypothetical protein
MNWNELFALILMIEIFVVLIMFAFLLPNIVDTYLKVRRRNKFGEEVSRLFEINKLDRTQLEIFAQEYFIKTKDIQIATRREFKKALNDKTPNNEKVEYFQNLYQEYERDEPFEGLPSDIRMHLEKAREHIGKGKEDLLNPLASQLQELSESNARKNRKMFLLAVASVVIGIASLAFSAYQYYTEPAEKEELVESESRITSQSAGTK